MTRRWIFCLAPVAMLSGFLMLAPTLRAAAPRSVQPSVPPTPRQDTTRCPVCRRAHRAGLCMTPLEAPRLHRCAHAPPLVMVAPRGVVRRAQLHALRIRFSIGDVLEGGGTLRFWDARGPCYERWLDPERTRPSIRPDELPGFAEAMERAHGTVTWTWETQGAPAPRARFHLVRLPIDHAQTLRRLRGQLRLAPRWVADVVSAQWMVDHNLLEEASALLQGVRATHPDEPHALALAYRVLAMRGLARNLVGDPTLGDPLARALKARAAGSLPCDLSTPVRPYAQDAEVSGGCGH